MKPHRGFQCFPASETSPFLRLPLPPLGVTLQVEQPMMVHRQAVAWLMTLRSSRIAGGRLLDLPEDEIAQDEVGDDFGRKTVERRIPLASVVADPDDGIVALADAFETPEERVPSMHA